MIKRIKWNDYKTIGNLELDFTNPNDGTVFSTIILAGENGTGKTTILETISLFLNRKSIKPFDYIANDGNPQSHIQHSEHNYYPDSVLTF